MKPSTLKRIIFLSIILVLLIPPYMYFSFDVNQLNQKYPHIQMADSESVEFTLETSRPKDWIPLRNISRSLQWAIVLSEDWSFYQHDGIDLEQVKVALNDMVTTKRFRGASTITQQMVKNVYLSEDRSLWRKLHEMILAQKVEKVLSKQKILEVYLNCIEFGPKIYGVKAATKHYFNKSPSGISPREGAFIAMLLPSPKRYYVSFKRKRLTKFAQKRIQKILEKMRMGKIISSEQYQNELLSRFAWES